MDKARETNTWSGPVLPVVRADSQSRADTSACSSSPESCGNGSSPAHVGTGKLFTDNRFGPQLVDYCKCISKYAFLYYIHSGSVTPRLPLPGNPTTKTYATTCLCFISTLMLSGTPSSRRLSFSLLVIVLSVSSTLGLELLLLLRCRRSVPVSAASLWSLLVLRVLTGGFKPPCPRSPASSDCLSLSSERREMV